MINQTCKAFILLVLLAFCGCSKKDAPKPAADKSLISFELHVTLNTSLKQDVTGEIIGDTVYVALLAGTNVSALVPTFSFKGIKITADGVEQTTAVTAHNFSGLVDYTVTAEDGSTKKYTVKTIDTGVPVLYLSTNNVPIESTEIYIDGSMHIAGSIANDTLYNGSLEIKGRGNSTWGMPKKPYKIKLDKAAALLGMNSDKKWVLLANYADKSLIRNEVAFELSRRMELAFTPAGKFVEVVLNGAYAGNYELVESIEVSDHRVNIAEMDEDAATLPGISGGYLVEMDGFAYGEPVYFETPHGLLASVHYPDDDDINQEQKDYIKNYFTGFENSLFAENFTDEVDGYQKYFDLESYVNWYLVNEIIGNPDTVWSTYMFKNKDDDKIYTGPVWDFDIAANNDERLGDAVNKLMQDAAHEPKQWIRRLMEDATFRHAVRDRWNVVKDAQVKSITLFVDELAKQLAYSQKANFKRWNILNEKVYLNLQVAGSYSGEINYFKQ